MKPFAERYTGNEFQLTEDIRSVLHITRNDRFSGNYQPYQIKANNSLSQLCFESTISNKDVSVNLKVRNLKLDFAIQVWEIAQDLTKKKYFDYLEYKWLKSNDPIKELVLISENRKKAESYFYQMLKEVCKDTKIVSSERVVFKRHEHIGYNSNDLQLEVSLNEDKITDEIKDKVYKQFSKGENHYLFDLKNQRFPFEEIKEYFVYCDSRLLGLLNATDGVNEITETEKSLFIAAENSNLEGVIIAVNQGANINAIDSDGETAFTKVFRNFNDKFCDTELSGKEAFTMQTIFIAQKMLELGADINFFGYGGVNALQFTAYAHNPTLMKFLLDNGANPNFNYFPEDGQVYITSSALDTILSDFNTCEDDDILNQCETLLINAGAK